MSAGMVLAAMCLAFACGVATGGNAWWRLGLRSGAEGALAEATRRRLFRPRVAQRLPEVIQAVMARRSSEEDGTDG